jgi:hypothetical protein
MAMYPNVYLDQWPVAARPREKRRRLSDAGTIPVDCTYSVGGRQMRAFWFTSFVEV